MPDSIESYGRAVLNSEFNFGVVEGTRHARMVVVLLRSLVFELVVTE